MDSRASEDREQVKKLYKNTLPGAVITFIKERDEVSVEELISHVSQVYSSLRNVSGCKYKGKNLKKIVFGLLSASVFNVKSDYISLNPDLLEEYEKNRIESIEIHRKRNKYKSKLAPEVSKNLTEVHVSLIERFCDKFKRDREFSNLFENAFKVLGKQKIKLDDSYEDAGAKVGYERLIGMIQGYEITKKFCIC